MREAAPTGELRLVIAAPSKAVRRRLVAAIKKSRGKIRCNPFLTDTEKDNKGYTYKEATKHNLKVEDVGDMMTVSNPRGSGMLHEVQIWLANSSQSID